MTTEPDAERQRRVREQHRKVPNPTFRGRGASPHHPSTSTRLPGNSTNRRRRGPVSPPAPAGSVKGREPHDQTDREDRSKDQRLAHIHLDRPEKMHCRQERARVDQAVETLPSFSETANPPSGGGDGQGNQKHPRQETHGDDRP